MHDNHLFGNKDNILVELVTAIDNFLIAWAGNLNSAILFRSNIVIDAIDLKVMGDCQEAATPPTGKQKYSYPYSIVVIVSSLLYA